MSATSLPATMGPYNPNRSLARKIAEVMGEVDRIKKNGRNDFHGYNYATESDITDAVRGHLAARNVSIIPSVVSGGLKLEPLTKQGRDGVTIPKGWLFLVPMTFTIMDGDSGEEKVIEWIGSGEDGSDKGVYKAMTGALKYFLLKLFMIPTGDDPEATNEKGEPTDKRRLTEPTNGKGAPQRVATPTVPSTATVTPPAAPAVQAPVAQAAPATTEPTQAAPVQAAQPEGLVTIEKAYIQNHAKRPDGSPVVVYAVVTKDGRKYGAFDQVGEELAKLAGAAVLLTLKQTQFGGLVTGFSRVS